MGNGLIFDEVVRRCDAGEAVALCTVVATRGSCPQSPGARMVVAGDGKTLGTLGGGCVEAEVRKRAVVMLLAGESGLLNFSLDHDYGWDDGLICGGVMDIHVDVIAPSSVDKLHRYRAVAESLRRNESSEFRLDFNRNGAPAKFVEMIDPPATLLIAGAGHVGQALARLGGELSFAVSVIDDRADYASAERFPNATLNIADDIAYELSRFPVDASTYIVIVTRGHQRDGAALAAVVKSNAKYVGLIGSKRKIKAIFDDLAQQGVPREALLRVHAPIGFEIGAVTVPEIAISIAAELIAVRRGRGDVSARPMKIDAAQINAWLDRSS